MFNSRKVTYGSGRFSQIKKLLYYNEKRSRRNLVPLIPTCNIISKVLKSNSKDPNHRFSLRLSAELIHGICIEYQQQLNHLLYDVMCNSINVNVNSNEIDETPRSSFEENMSVHESGNEMCEDQLTIEHVLRDCTSFDDIHSKNVYDMGMDKARSSTPAPQDLSDRMRVGEFSHLTSDINRNLGRNISNSFNNSFCSIQRIHETYDTFFDGMTLENVSNVMVKKRRKKKFSDKHKCLTIFYKRLNPKCYLRCNSPEADIVDLTTNYVNPILESTRAVGQKLTSLIKKNFNTIQEEVDKDLFMEVDGANGDLVIDENLTMEVGNNEDNIDSNSLFESKSSSKNLSKSSKGMSKSSNEVESPSVSTTTNHSNNTHTPQDCTRSTERNKSGNFLLTVPIRKRRTKNYDYSSNSHSKCRHIYLLIPDGVTNIEEMLIFDNSLKVDEYLSDMDEDVNQFMKEIEKSPWDPADLLMKLEVLWEKKGSFINMEDVFKLGNLGDKPIESISKALQSLATLTKNHFVILIHDKEGRVEEILRGPVTSWRNSI